MFLGQTLEFLRVFRKQAKHNDAFNRKANVEIFKLSELQRKSAW